jgi:2-C-methyl-D-erythritol 4-phosphate cytidylyltransferase
VKKYAVIVAAGLGNRMGSDVPKQFLLINGKAVLWYTLSAFLKAFSDIQIVLVLHEQHLDTGRQLVDSLGERDRITIVKGGNRRFDSVKNGLRFVVDPAVVFIHDGARCLVTEKLIRKCYEEAIQKGSAIPVIKPVDSLRIDVEEGTVVLDRNKVHIVQTPQTFMSQEIINAFNQEYDDSFTDEATVAEKAGLAINLIEGEKENMKITFPDDLTIAMFYLLNR